MEFSALTVDRFVEDFMTGFCSQMYFFSKLKLLGISSPFPISSSQFVLPWV